MSMRTTPLLSLGIGVGAAALLLALPSLAQSPKPSGTITARMAGDWDTLDPQKTRATYGYQMVYSLYDRLVALESGNAPVMATDRLTCSSGRQLHSWFASISRGRPRMRLRVTNRSQLPAQGALSGVE
jgi:ABC-type oligopeptide transport system substrate-binding subunit